MPRNLLDIDETKVLKMARHGLTNLEIADIFGCDNSTIGKRFSKILTKGRAQRKNVLRRCQWKAAIEGNIPMLIWLGKQDLGQADKLETKSETRTTVVERDKQRAMLGNGRAIELACDLDAEISRSRVRGDDPGGVRGLGE
jgi:hypothetical protein